MNRTDLLKKIFELYPSSFSEKNAKIWREAYEAVIPEFGYDFKKLYTILISEHTSTVYAPPPAWFYERLKTAQIKEKAGTIEKIEGVPPPPELKEKLLRICGKNVFKFS